MPIGWVKKPRVKTWEWERTMKTKKGKKLNYDGSDALAGLGGRGWVGGARELRATFSEMRVSKLDG